VGGLAKKPYIIIEDVTCENRRPDLPGAPLKFSSNTTTRWCKKRAMEAGKERNQKREALRIGVLPVEQGVEKALITLRDGGRGIRIFYDKEESSIGGGK